MSDWPYNALGFLAGFLLIWAASWLISDFRTRLGIACLAIGFVLIDKATP